MAEFASHLPDVVLARDNLYMCGDPGQNLIQQDITEHKLNRVVVAACSVRMHEPTFRACVAEAGLNPFLMEMANIREQDTWVHSHEPEGALDKAKELVAAAVAKVRHCLTPLDMIKVPVTKTAHGHRRRRGRHQRRPGPGRHGHQDLPGGEGAEHRGKDGAAEQDLPHDGLFHLNSRPQDG